jgi:filamentous hemagglutinin family protein
VSLVLLSFAQGHAQTLPTGGSVAAGSAMIRSGANSITVHQQSAHAVVNWNSFNVGFGKTVTFDQPGAGSATLNRVSGAGISNIAGSVTSNGQVFLVNRNGIIITPTGTVKTAGGFVGSTLDITNADFMAGRYNFAGNGAGAIVNQGAITANPGSAIALLGASVSNEGVISAPLGKVAIGSGQAITLDFSGNGVLQVAVPTDLVGANDQALISNSGTIDADGGRVMVKAAAAQEAVRRTVNMSGVITAKSVSGHDGSVVLDGGEGGDVTVSGKIDASGETQGGQIDVTGHSVSLAGASLTATGGLTGGLVRVGGMFQGGQSPQDVSQDQIKLFTGRFAAAGTLAAAQTTSIDPTSSIDVSGGSSGGTAIVWSSAQTTQQGTIKATGLAGGAVEISSHKLLQSDVSKVRVGPGGTLLLDPKNIYVVTSDAFVANGGSDDETTYSGQVDYDSTSTDSYFDVAKLEAVVNGGTDLVLKASNDITFSAPFSVDLSVASPGNIYLSAGRTVTLSNVTLNHSNLTVVANDVAANGVDSSQRGSGKGEIDTFNATVTNGATIFGGAGSGGSGGNISLTVGTGIASNSAGDLRLGGIRTDGSGDITLSTSSQSGSKIAFFPDVNMGHANDPVAITAAGAVTLTGNFEADTPGGLTVTGQTVTWTDEATAKIGTYAAGSPITFTEVSGVGQTGVITRYGVAGGSGGGEGGSQDLTRVSLGAGGTAPQYTALYGDNSTVFTAAHITAGTLQGTDTISTVAGGLNVTFAGPAANSPPDTYNVTISATPNTGAFPQGYFVNLTTVTDKIQILSNVVTPTVASGSYVYGSPVALVTLSGVVGSDVVVPVASISGIGSVSLSAMGSGFGFGQNTAAGNFTYTVTSLAGTNASRYTLASGTFSASLSISPKPISYVISDTSTVYGTLANPNALLISSEKVGSDDVSIGTIAGTRGGVTATLSAATSPGSYMMSVATLSGAAATNYTIDAANSTTGTLTISAKPLNYSVGNASSTYGTLAVPPSPVLAGVVNGDDVTAISQITFGGNPVSLSARSAAGNYTLSVSGLSGTTASNYTLSNTGNTDGVLTIAPLSIGYSVATASQTYGSQSVVVSLSGVLTGDTVSPVITEGGVAQSLSEVSTGAYAYGDRTPVGLHSFTLTGVSNQNYSVNATSGVNGTLTVLPKTVTYAITDLGTTYGTTPAPAAVLTGALGGDDLSAPVTAKSGANIVSLGVHTAPGSYSLTVTALSGGAAGNYVLASLGNSDATLTIVPRALTYSVGDVGSTYGTSATIGSSTLSNIVSGDTVTGAVTVLQGGSPVTLSSQSAAGTYTLSVLALSGAQASNYVLAGSGNRDGTLTIAPKSLTYTIADSSSVYGTLAAPTVTFSGVLSGDNVGGVLGALVFNNIFNGPTFTVTDRTVVGPYQVFLTGLNGADAANYSLGARSFANLTINPLPIHYVIGSSTWVYGDGMTVTDGISLVGVMAGDTVIPGHAVQIFDSANHEIGSATGLTVGTYTESVPTGTGTLNGAQGPNYLLDSTGNTNGVITITPRPISALTNLTVQPSQPYGTLRPGDTLSTVTLAGLVYATNVQAVTSYSPQPASTSGHLTPGTYTFTVTGITGPDAFNYSFSGATTATLTVTPKVLSSALGSITSTYGTLAGIPTSVLTGVVSGDQVSGGTISVSQQTINGSVPTTLTATSPAGVYSLSTSSLTGADAANYSVGSGSGTLTIARKMITATAVNSTSTYGTLAALSNPILAGVVGSDDVRGTYSSQILGNLGGSIFGTNLTAQTAVGSYTITVNGLTGSTALNYTLAATNSTSTLTISPKPLSYTYTSMTQSQIYGATPANTVQLVGVLPGDDVQANVYATVTSSPAGDTFNPAGAVRVMGTTLPVGVYNVALAASGNRYSLSGATSGNYILANDNVASLGVVTITPRSLGYGLGVAVSRPIYGSGDAVTLTLANAAPGTTLDYTLVATSGTTATDLGAINSLPVNFPAGTYQLSLRPTMIDAYNYALSPANSTGVGVTILPKSITAAVNAADGTYGTPWDNLVDLPGLVAGDTVTPVVTISGVTQAVTLTSSTTGYGMSSAPSAGSHTLTLTSLSGASAGNYTLANPGTTVTVSIAQKTLTFSVAPVTGQYGGLSLPSCTLFGCEMAASLTFKPGASTLDGIVNNDNVTGNVQLTDGTNVFNYATNTPAGTYIQVVTSLSGTGAANYKLATSGNTGGVMTIQPGWVQVSVSSGGLVYNGTSSTTVGTPGVATVERAEDTGPNTGPLYGFVPGDDVSVTIGIFNIDGTPYAGGQPIQPGNYLLESVGLTGASAGNYRLVGQQNIAKYGLAGSTPGQYSVVDNSIFDFSLLGSTPNQIYTPPAVASKPIVTTSSNASATSTSTVSVGVTGGSVSSTQSASASAGASVGILGVSSEASATTTNLASFGLTGVTLSSVSSAGTNVTVSLGPAYVSYGGSADTQGTVSLSLSQNPSLKLSGMAQVGANETVGVAGGLGNGVSGSVANTTSAFAEARSTTTIGLTNGTLKVGTEEWAGVGASTGVSGSVSGGGVSGSASVTVYSPGSLGLGATSTSGYSDGTVTIGFSLGISIGIGGLKIAPSISFPTATIVSDASTVASAATYVFTGKDNSCNSACQQAAAAQALANKMDTAKKMASGGANLALVSYLNANPDVVAAAQGQTDFGSRMIVSDYNNYATIPTQLNSVVAQEQALVSRLQSNPASISLADLQQAQSLRAQEASLITRTGQIGAKIAVTNGTIGLVSK